MRGKSRRLVFALSSLVLLSSWCAPVRAQQEPAAAGLSSIPYGEWVAAGERQEIQWKVRVASPILSFHQRLRAGVAVLVSADKLQKGSVERDLILLVKLQDATGRWLPGAGLRTFQLTERLAKRTEMGFGVDLFVQPGQYSVAVILYDRVTGQRSVALRKLRVRPLGDDPLREADGRLPVVEFLPPLEESAVEDNSYLAAIRGKLDLPVRTERRVHIEILANFSPSEQYSGSRFVQSRNFSILLPTLKLLSQMDLSNGSLTITALDLDRQTVFYQQQNVRALDWPRLREALGTLRTGVVDVRQLKTRHERATFFREVLERRLNARPVVAETGNGSEGGGDESAPYRVFIVVGSGILFPRGSDLQPVQLEQPCRCSVYYIQYRVFFQNLWDELHRVFKPLDPKRFQVTDAADMRKALGAILEDLRDF